MNGLVLRLELRRSSVSTFWLAVVGVAYAAVVAFMYPLIQKNADVVMQYMDRFPKGFLAAFGMTGSLASPGVFFNTYLGVALWPILAAIAVSLVATRVFAADAERGWLEVVLATPLTRTSLGLVSVATQAVVLLALTVATVGAVFVAGRAVGAPFDAGRFAIAAVVLFGFACAVAGVTSLVGVLTLRRSVAGGVMAAILLLMYLFNIVAQLQPDLGWLASISAFRYLATTSIIDHGTSPIEPLVVFGTVAAAGWVLSVIVFRRRDLLA